LVHPREVFKAAILANSAAIIFGHNHPSGDPEPSPDDVALCTRLRHAGEIVGIDLLDFVIIGEGGRHCSFKEAGR
jgi:DNA repair protein RadC